MVTQFWNFDSLVDGKPKRSLTCPPLYSRAQFPKSVFLEVFSALL